MDINTSWDLAIIITSIVSLFSGALLAAFALRRMGDLIDAFKSGALVFQSPVRTNKADFSSWIFEQVFDTRSGKSELTIFVQTNRGEVILPTMLVSEWASYIAALPGAKNQKSNNGQQSKKAKKGKSKNGVFVGAGSTIANKKVLLVDDTQIDLFPNMRIRLSDGTSAQIKGLQINRQPVQKADAGANVGIELDVNAIAGAIHRA